MRTAKNPSNFAVPSIILKKVKLFDFFMAIFLWVLFFDPFCYWRCHGWGLPSLLRNMVKMFLNLNLLHVRFCTQPTWGLFSTSSGSNEGSVLLSPKNLRRRRRQRRGDAATAPQRRCDGAAAALQRHDAKKRTKTVWKSCKTVRKRSENDRKQMEIGSKTVRKRLEKALKTAWTGSGS